ncbi:PAS domain S-box protein [Anatilimnocola sp. NA78]|uniref:PAS domain S-box protein n=1 Tax=Anatilimnocola sp. NA78 TaxID=3415683 RepID=UPI003CE4A157
MSTNLIAFFTIDLAGRATSWDEEVEQLLGYRQQEFVGLVTLSKILAFSPEDERANRNVFYPSRAERRVVREERLAVRKNGDRFRAALVYTPISDDEGTLLAYNVVLQQLEVPVPAVPAALDMRPANPAPSKSLDRARHFIRH